MTSLQKQFLEIADSNWQMHETGGLPFNPMNWFPLPDCVPENNNGKSDWLNTLIETLRLRDTKCDVIYSYGFERIKKT